MCIFLRVFLSENKAKRNPDDSDAVMDIEKRGCGSVGVGRGLSS